MTLVGAAYEQYLPKRREVPPIDPRGIRVSIPGHPEIVAYKMPGVSNKSQIVADLIKLNSIISQESDSPEE